ncbi:hypothetical protein, partial [Escherichia coli]|uniref:hypothetical protein n=1 Tax=Escherichia coli TaxID=562 RepID=UPI0032E37397
QALAVRHRLVAAWRLATGPDSDETLEAEEYVIAAHMMLGDAPAATQAAAGYSEDRRLRLGDSHGKARQSAATLARLVELQGDWEALIGLRREALARVRSSGEDKHIIQDLEFALADALAAAGKDDE